jgi:hypothetical protein
MNQYEIVAIISLLGWLVLAGSALASYRLGWGQMARMALTWLAIFVGLFLLVGFLVGG